MQCKLSTVLQQPCCGAALRPTHSLQCRASAGPAASRSQGSSCAQSRRDALGLLAGASLAWAQAADAAKPAAAPPPPPPTGACSDCVGEIDSTLNACNLTSPSCVSSQNEDESHFEAPWQYEGSQKAAVKRLIKAVTEEPLNDRSPQGILVDHHQGNDGSDYVRFVFGKRPRGAEDWKMDDALDAEFLFLAGDNIVDLRAASRTKPNFAQGSVGFSIEGGVKYDTNVARKQLEDLRKSLRWDIVPVITGFDPKYNSDKALWFEKLYQPFLGSRARKPDKDIPWDMKDPQDFVGSEALKARRNQQLTPNR